jgi:nitronate monooxygenase
MLGAKPMELFAKAAEWCRTMGIQWPLIQAPMAGGATTPSLIAAVCNSGGLGSLGAGYMSPSQIEQAIHEIRKLTAKPFAINLFVPELHTATTDELQKAQTSILECSSDLGLDNSPVLPPYAPEFAEQMEIVLQQKVPYFSFTFGIPEQKWLKRLRENGTRIIGTATNLKEAKALEKNEVDMIVAQGKEAGGHRGSFLQGPEDNLVELATLIPILVRSSHKPVIASGGLMNGQHIAKMLGLGAYAVQLGTAFLTCPEAGIHRKYKDLLLAQTKDNTVLTRTFSGKFARGIKNTFIQRMTEKNAPILDYPIQNALTRPMRNAAAQQDNVEFMSLWAGQSAHLCRNLQASELVQRLMEETQNSAVVLGSTFL